ncbi:hypothetical protein Bca4012_054604 [Brassica carinata]
MASSSTSLTLLAPPSSLPKNWKHHVFPSFHGPDVRKTILGHIRKEFKSKGIDLFIDNNIERSKSIGPELIEAIKGSRISIVLLSKNYASSTWCLNELVEIIKCREVLDQTVITLFYEADPTDIKKQTGDFGKVFKETCKGKTEEDIRRWKHALTEVAQIAGYHSSSTNWETEAEMIEAIATDVSNKLNFSAPSNDFDSIVGMESHMTEMRPLLPLDSDESVRKIGIWGPSGIGKTTIARYIFNQYSQDFQTSVFIDNIRRNYAAPACSDKRSVKLGLQEKLMSQVTNDKDIKVPHLGVAKDRLKDKKVLVVLDDVDHSVQVEAMADETWVGPGSLIIITTQDQRVLKASRIDHIHRVRLPRDDEALQIFCINAFGQKYPKDGFKELAWKVMYLVGRLPLGLEVMGSYFRGMSEQEWTEALPNLRAHLDRDGEIASVLSWYGGSLSSTIFFGCETRASQYPSEPGKRQFLNDAKDIVKVLSDDKAGNSSVIGINFDRKEKITTSTSERAFERFSNLQFLRIGGKGVNPGSMNYMSRELRVLIWSGFQMTCFPSSFNPEFLVELTMGSSQLEKLWEGNKPLNNLRLLNLNSSHLLKELPDLSTAINLYYLSVYSCSSLWELPSSIGNAINLQIMDLRYCSSLVELPSSIGNAINLYRLNLSGCSNLVELPYSIGNLTNLRELDLSDCSSLVDLPDSMRNLGRLSKLKLERCSKLEFNLANLNLESLEELDLSGCFLLKSYLKSQFVVSGVKELVSHLPDWLLSKIYPESSTEIEERDPWIGRISRLKSLKLSGMKKLVSLPQLPDSLVKLEADDCESLERLDCSFTNQDIRLNFANCFKLNQEAIDLIIQTPTNKYAIFPGGEVPMCFTYRSSGSSLTVKLNQTPVGKSAKFKACILCASDDENNIGRIFRSICCSITSGENSLTYCKKEVEAFFLGHLYTFEVEVETEEVTSTELVFDFELLISDSTTWKMATKIMKFETIRAADIAMDEDYGIADDESLGDSDEEFGRWGKTLKLVERVRESKLVAVMKRPLRVKANLGKLLMVLEHALMLKRDMFYVKSKERSMRYTRSCRVVG